MMTMDEIFKLSLKELSELVKGKKVSPFEITKHYFERIEKQNKKLNAFVYINKLKALKSAELATKDIYNGEIKSLLHGLPVAHKDLYSTKDIETTAGSKLLKNNIPL